MIRAALRRLRSEQFRKKGEDMIGSIGSNRAEAFDQADLVDRAELIKDNLSRLPLKTNGRGWDRDDLFGKECVLAHSGWWVRRSVMGATLTVSICRFISSGEMIRQGRVFLISRPSVGSRRTR